MEKLIFTELNLREWERAEVFYYFSKMAPTGYSLTVNVDITYMKAVLNRAGLKFFPAYLWLVTTCLNMQKEFEIAEKGGKLGFYNYLTPLYPVFHDETKTFSLMWTKYSKSFKEFYASYLENARLYGNNHGILAQRGLVPPENAYTVSCLPWVSFEHFSVHSYENKPYYFPSVEAGKFFKSGEKLLMPLSITCHHAAADGRHVKRFLENFGRLATNFEEYIRALSQKQLQMYRFGALQLLFIRLYRAEGSF